MSCCFLLFPIDSDQRPPLEDTHANALDAGTLGRVETVGGSV